MKRTQLRNIADKTKSQDDIQKYKVERNLVVTMNRMAKGQFYAKVDPTLVGKDKIF